MQKITKLEGCFNRSRLLLAGAVIFTTAVPLIRAQEAGTLVHFTAVPEQREAVHAKGEPQLRVGGQTAPADTLYTRLAGCGKASLQTRDAALAAGKGAVVVLLDTTMYAPALGQVLGGWGAAQGQTHKLMEWLPPEAPVAVYSFDSALHPMRVFQKENGKLTTAVVDGSTAERKAALNAFQKKTSPNPHLGVRFSLSGQAAERYGLLESLSQHLAGLPGRKAIVWYCHNSTFSIEPYAANALDQARVRALQSLQAAGVALYPVSCENGGPPAPDHPPPPGVNPDPFSGYIPPSQHRDFPQLPPWRERIQPLVQLSGGRLAAGYEKLLPAVRQAIDDLGCYEEVRSSASPASGPSLLPIDFQDHDADTAWLYPKFLFSAPQPVDEAGRLADAERIMRFPLEATALSVNAHLETNGGAWSGAVAIDPNDIALLEGGHGLLDVLWGFFGSDGARLAGGLHNQIKLEIPAAEREAFLRRPLSVNRPLELPPATAEVRVVVRDSTSGSMGSVRIFVPR